MQNSAILKIKCLQLIGSDNCYFRRIYLRQKFFQLENGHNNILSVLAMSNFNQFPDKFVGTSYSVMYCSEYCRFIGQNGFDFIERKEYTFLSFPSRTNGSTEPQGIPRGFTLRTASSRAVRTGSVVLQRGGT